MSKKPEIDVLDACRDTEILTHIDPEGLLPIPKRWDDYQEKPWGDLGKDRREKVACVLDDTNILPIPRPATKEEEDALVAKFLSGMEKLFDQNNNWTFLQQLETTVDHCAKCNTCSEACHVYEGSGNLEMYRPLYRSEIFRRIYKKYVKKELLSSFRNGDIELNWKTIARLGELAYRCNLCRRCAQTCPIGADNGLIAREIRKLFSQELGLAAPELHQQGTVLQLKVGSSTGMNTTVVKDNVEFIDEDFSEQLGVKVETHWDVKGADILLVHNAGEILSWPDNVASFSLLFNRAGLSWTLSSEAVGYDSVNYGVFYDDVQLARIAIQHAKIAKKLGVKKIVVAECGHAHKSLIVTADRVLPPDLQIPRESCFPILRDIVFSGKLKLDPSRNDFPVTVHDPCNVTRLMGIIKPQRDVLHELCPQFREMKQHGPHNFCCGGGSGLAIMSRGNLGEWRTKVAGRKKLEQILEAFSDCRGPQTQKYVCAPCSNCKGQMRDLIAYYELMRREQIQYAGLVELIVNAMVDVKPGFIKWGEDDA